MKVALSAIEPIKAVCEQSDEPVLQRIGEQLNCCTIIRDRIEHEINPDAPNLVNRGGIIRKGVNDELDELREISYSGKDYLLHVQQRESEKTGIPSLKIGYNNVFGYYIEVRSQGQGSFRLDQKADVGERRALYHPRVERIRGEDFGGRREDSFIGNAVVQ